jgi:S-formylglutathione hydrolase FrmB
MNTHAAGRNFWLILAGLACLLLAGPARGQPAGKVSAAVKDGNGFLVHTVESAYQGGPTKIRVLLPDRLEKGRRYPVLYVLPVEAGDGNHYGDGLAEVKKLGLHNKYGLICVAPTFAKLPWYADHPTDKSLRQEEYFLRVILPFVEGAYPVLAEVLGRLLLGFSKSGWGAITLLLRHPDVFGKAAAWDAPLMMTWPSKYGSQEIFGTRENFERYRVTKLLEDQAGKLGEGKRLAVFGYGSFRQEHRAAHDLMDRLKVGHEYRDGPARKHDWHSGWVAEAVEFLAAPAPSEPEASATVQHGTVADASGSDPTPSAAACASRSPAGSGAPASAAAPPTRPAR